jgi:hypothetical protein
VAKRKIATPPSEVTPPKPADIKLPPFHPLAKLFDLLSDKELDELAGDIQRRSQRFPITTYKGQIIDGRNRALACARVGIEPKYIEFDGSEEDIPRFVISANIHRRHLTAEQRRDLIKRFLQADPTKSDRDIADTVKVSPTTVGAVRKATVQSGQLDAPPAKRTGKDGKTRKLPSTKSSIKADADSGGVKRARNIIKTKAKKPPDINRFAEDVALRIGGHIHNDTWNKKLLALAEFQADIDPSSRNMLVKTLNGLARRASTFAKTIESGSIAELPGEPMLLDSDNGAKVRELERLLGAAQSEIGDLEIALREARGDPPDVKLVVITEKTPVMVIAKRLVKLLSWEDANNFAFYLAEISEEPAEGNAAKPSQPSQPSQPSKSEPLVWRLWEDESHVGQGDEQDVYFAEVPGDTTGRRYRIRPGLTVDKKIRNYLVDEFVPRRDPPVRLLVPKNVKVKTLEQAKGIAHADFDAEAA